MMYKKDELKKGGTIQGYLSTSLNAPNDAEFVFCGEDEFGFKLEIVGGTFVYLGNDWVGYDVTINNNPNLKFTITKVDSDKEVLWIK